MYGTRDPQKNLHPLPPYLPPNSNAAATELTKINFPGTSTAAAKHEGYAAVQWESPYVLQDLPQLSCTMDPHKNLHPLPPYLPPNSNTAATELTKINFAGIPAALKHE